MSICFMVNNIREQLIQYIFMVLTCLYLKPKVYLINWRFFFSSWSEFWYKTKNFENGVRFATA